MSGATPAPREGSEQTAAVPADLVALTGWDWAAFVVFGLLALVIGVGGFSLSFTPVTREMTPAFGRDAWRVPAIIDLSIFVFSGLDVVLARLKMGHPLLRLIPLTGTAATITLNASIGGGAAASVAHVAMPSTWVAFTEVARHVVRRRTRLAAGRGREGIPAARWLAAPLRSTLLWRRMVLWEVRSYDEAIRRELRRLDTVAALRDEHGPAWRLKVGRNARLRLSLGLIGPDQARAVRADGAGLGEIGDLGDSAPAAPPEPPAGPKARAAPRAVRRKAPAAPSEWPSVPAQEGGGPAGTEQDPDRRARIADAVYRAYQGAERPLGAVRLSQLSGYSKRSAYRARKDLAVLYGAITATDLGEDSAFAAELAARIASGWPPDPGPDAAGGEGAAAQPAAP